MALSALSSVSDNYRVFFLNKIGEQVPGRIWKEPVHTSNQSPQIDLSPFRSDELSSSDSPSRSPLLHSEFVATVGEEATEVGSMWLSVRKDCFEGETQLFLWIDRIDNSSSMKIKQVGTALMEAAIEESLTLGLGGRVKLMAIANSHLFYLKCGFLPEKQVYAYPECIPLTQFLKRAGLQQGKLRHPYYNTDPMMKRTIEILSIENNKKEEEIDLAFIQQHWYWDDRYPMRPVEYYAEFMNRVQTLSDSSPRAQLSCNFQPLQMFLPDKSLEIWKRIIATPRENTKERNTLILQLRSILSNAAQCPEYVEELHQKDPAASPNRAGHVFESTDG